MNKKIKINFADFWPNFIKTDNYFYNLLSTKYKVEISDNPDVLFFSVDYDRRGDRFKYKDCLRVFYTGENVGANWNECDLAFTFEHLDNPRQYRLPLWALHLNWFNVEYNKNRDQAYLFDLNTFLDKPYIVTSKYTRDYFPAKKFCSFVASQPKGYRVEFVPRLSSLYKTVDCGGQLYNNIGGLIPGRGDTVEKISFYAKYKFNIAMENCSSPGYCTEKIICSMFAFSIPIYWGSESVVHDFNPNSFINCHLYSSTEEIIDVVKELDMDDKKYLDKMGEPWFINYEIPDFVRPENVLQFLDKHID